MTLCIAIAGAGNMGKTHARHWSRVPDVKIVAVADVDRNKAETVAGVYGAQPFGSVEEMLSSQTGATIDVVDVCTPTDTHRSVTETVFAAGKHVFCEKPLALTLDDCDAMIAAAASANKLLGVGQVVRFFHEFESAKRLVDAGKVGNPAAVRTRRGGDFPRPENNWYADTARSGGVILDLIVHDFDWLLWCFGPVSRVYAHSLTERLSQGKLNHLDYALVTLRHESGVVGHVEGTWANPGGFSTAFEIAGDGGLLTHDSRRAAPLYQTRRTAEGKTGGVVIPSSPLAPDDDPYFRQLVSFADSVQNGTPIAVTPQEARAAVAVALAAMESARTGQAVTPG